MHRAIINYKITKRKDGRYYVRIRDKGDVTHIYGKTKAGVTLILKTERSKSILSSYENTRRSSKAKQKLYTSPRIPKRKTQSGLSI